MQTVGQMLSQHLREDDESQPYKGQSRAITERLKAVEWLFNQFSIRYGAALMASVWNGLDPDEVKLVWAQALATMPRRCVAFALCHLPTMPPKLDEFVAMCRRCPPETYKALPYILTNEEKQRNRERIAELAARFGSRAMG